MQERQGLVTLSGTPVTLVGTPPTIGEKAPDFTALDTLLQPKSLSDFAGAPLIIASVPSLDTSVCDTEARRFNQEAATLSDDSRVLVISMDLPFAQKRWCAAAGIDRVITLSDHRDASFGLHWGVLMKELRLLARAVFVVDRRGILRFTELVSEATNEPSYAAALDAARAIS